MVKDVPLGWNLATGLTPHNELLRAVLPHLFLGDEIPGLTTTNLYIGAPGSSFFLHSEDQNLPSANYLLMGAPKVWYAVPSKYYSAVVALVGEVFSYHKLAASCPQATMHKRFMLHPDALRAHGIPVSRVVQRPGDMILTAPGAFHFGYNCGPNLAEATNFATKSWFSGGHYHDALASGTCTCPDARFHFDDYDLRAALLVHGEPFGFEPEDVC